MTAPELVALLHPAMVHQGPPEFDGAVWVGELPETAVATDRPGAVRLAGSDGYSSARLLVRDGRLLRGFVELPVVGGCLDASELATAVAGLPPVEPAAEAAAVPVRELTVVLCTRDRPEPLRTALESLIAATGGGIDIVVVDNASRTDATASLVRELQGHPGGHRIRLVREPVPGLARARNTGVLAARTRYVAFTDDDVVVDRHWLDGIAAGFARRPAGTVGCVTGIVPSGEVRALSQLYFERRVWWSHQLTPRVFSLATPPDDEPLFPFRVGLYGTGANFAVDREALLRLGGFDEALGVGSPTGGGEDIDLFVRMLHAGHGLAYEPSALVWHRHRADAAALMVQAKGYGLGLGAWLTTVALDPRLAARALRRAVGAVRHLLTTTKVDTTTGAHHGLAPAQAGALRRAELAAVLRGPFALLRARIAGARRRPLLDRASRREG